MKIITLEESVLKLIESKLAKYPEHLNEFLTVPTGLVEVVNLGGMKLYSSESLKQDFLKAISTNPVTKSSMDVLNKLVSKDKIMPCWTGSNFLKNVLLKIFTQENILGLFIPSLNRILIIMNSSVNIFGFADETRLSAVTIHEAMHMSAANSRVNFLKIWKNELDLYYTSMFSLMFDIDKKDKQLQTQATAFYNDIYNTFEHLDPRKFKNSGKMLEAWELMLDKYIKPLMKISELSKQEFEDSLYNLKLFGKYFVKDFETLMANYMRFKSVFMPMFIAYRSIGAAKMPNTTVCQELFYPSEVICIGTLFPTFSKQKVKQALSIIKI